MTARLGKQSTAILAALLEGQTVSPMDARRLCGSWRLAARVKDLRLAGWNVVSERVSDGERTFAAYHIPLGSPRIIDRQMDLFDRKEAAS